MRKNVKCDLKIGKNKRMNDNTYAERRVVMNYIYEAKNLLRTIGVELPRIDIRITKGDDKHILGAGRMGGKIVWIPQQSLTRNDLREVVFHEILHAVLATPHNENCPLMGSYVEGLTDEDTNKHFLKYFK